MLLRLLKKGDEVLNVTNEFVAIRRKKGEVDVIPIIKESKYWRIDIENIVTIGYENAIAIFENENKLRIINF